MTLLKTLISKYWVYGLKFIILMVIVVFIWRYIANIQTINQQQAITITQLELVIKNRDGQIVKLKQQNKDNQQALIQLRQQQQHATELISHNEIELERLKHDNEDLKKWADTPLPIDVIRLHSRQNTINNSRDYQRFLSGSGPLQDTK